jgi:hypothetical protein
LCAYCTVSFVLLSCHYPMVVCFKLRMPCPSLTQRTGFICSLLSLGGANISTWLFTIPDGRTWLGTSYLSNGRPSFFFFFFSISFDLLVCVRVGDCPRYESGFWIATLSSLISVAPCAGTPSRQEHNLIFCSQGRDIADAFVPCVDVFVYLT